ncbi:MAG: CPXCG motif-containing cysteine-rich protein [Owenweeksia sp.]|nr:CPXCG motif-containing cysteine-rich protein [Owenweeksia sp.]
MEEVFYTCPDCFSQASLLIDPSQNRQQYIEDCERCCNPIEFRIEMGSTGEVQFLDATPIGQ